MKKKGIVYLILSIVWLLSLAACNGSTKNDISVGNPAPNFNLIDSEGNQVSLSSFQGQPVLLFFHMAGG